ncbi:MAG: nucleoside deaminase [Acidimicrobiia bacterium]
MRSVVQVHVGPPNTRRRERCPSAWLHRSHKRWRACNRGLRQVPGKCGTYTPAVSSEFDVTSLEPGGWEALEQSYAALMAGGLPCGAALADADGVIVSRGRNHAYDHPTGTDPLEATPLAHAEMNVLARLPTERDLSSDTLWSSQQPCAMCAAALEFCGVGTVRFLALDPSAIGSYDGGAARKDAPPGDDPVPEPWALFANVMFLQGTLGRHGPDTEMFRRNLDLEPETAELALACHRDQRLVSPHSVSLTERIPILWPDLMEAADRRRSRLRY